MLAWQHIRFGEWWRLDRNALDRHISDTLAWYLRYCDLLDLDADSGSTRSPLVLPNRYDSGSDLPGSELQPETAEGLFRECLNIITRTGPRIHEVHNYIYSRWFRRSDPIECLSEIKDALVSKLNVKASWLQDARITFVPDGFPANIDLAMFPPLPPWVRPELWVAKDAVVFSKIDPGVAARLLVAIAHEGVGHLLQYYSCVSGATDGCVLDSELMEGWGVAAENFAHHLGEVEGEVADMYRVKRILPLVSKMHPDIWNEKYRPALEAQFPEFLTSPEFSVYRVGVGTHARGLLRILELTEKHSDRALWTQPAYSPWIRSF